MLVTSLSRESHKTIFALLNNPQMQGGRVLLVFNHGLGDLINFLPLFDALQAQLPAFDFYVGFNVERDFGPLHPKMVPLWTDHLEDYQSSFAHIFQLVYPDSHPGMLAKPFLCNLEEIGLPLFNYTAATVVRPAGVDTMIGRVGVNFFGHTGNRLKAPTETQAKNIWRDIKNLGMEPYEVHMRPQFITEKATHPEDIFQLATKENSMRFELPSVTRMMEGIASCEFFLGIDAGPLYLAVALLGPAHCGAFEKYKLIGSYLPLPGIPTMDINGYQPGHTCVLLEKVMARVHA